MKHSKKESTTFDTATRLGVLPKSVIFKAFGGFKSKEAKFIAEGAEVALLEHLRMHNLIIDVGYSNGKPHLIFAQHPHRDASNDL